MRKVLLATLIVALGACSPPSSDTGDDPGSATQSASAAATRPGDEIRLGRWRKTITVMGQQTVEVECVTSVDLNQLASEPNSHCTSAAGLQRTPEGLVYEAECTGDDGGGHIRTVMNGDMQTHYTADMTMTGAGMGQGMQVRIEGAYEGACRGDE